MAAVVIQARVRAFLVSSHYKIARAIRRERAALRIQAGLASFRVRKDFMMKKLALMKCQGNVLCRQLRRAYLKLRKDSILCQALIRRYLAKEWYTKVRMAKNTLEGNIESIRELIHKHNLDAQEFRGCFVNKSISRPFKYLSSLEEYELAKSSKGLSKEDATLPKLQDVVKEIERLKKENNELQAQVMKLSNDRGSKLNIEEDKELKAKLGAKYEELPSMISKLKEDLQRVNEYSKNAKPLPLKIQHPYQYSKWDRIHDPDNVVENTLTNDAKVYKVLNPAIDITLSNGAYCFVSEVLVYGGEPYPAKVEVYKSNVPNSWILIKKGDCEPGKEIRLEMPGEQVMKYLRVRFPTNIRGGNIVAIRFISVKGIVKN